MKFPKSHTLKQIAELINCDFVGNDAFPVLGMNEIHVVEPGDIVFVDHPKYYDKALESAATIILINKEVDSILEESPDISAQELIEKMSNLFKVSQRAMEIRLMKLDYIEDF